MSLDMMMLLMVTAELSFKDVRVPKENLTFRRGKRF